MGLFGNKDLDLAKRRIKVLEWEVSNHALLSTFISITGGMRAEVSKLHSIMTSINFLQEKNEILAKEYFISIQNEFTESISDIEESRSFMANKIEEMGESGKAFSVFITQNTPDSINLFEQINTLVDLKNQSIEIYNSFYEEFLG